MVLQWNTIEKNKPAIFDWLVFTISLLMGLIFPELRDLTASASFSGWMLAGLVIYMLGLWLKHKPLYYRLAKQDTLHKGVLFVLFLIIGHWVIMLAVVIIAEDAVRHIAGMPQVQADAPVSGWLIFNSIVAALLITWLAFRGGGKMKKQLSEKYLFIRELIGDILLIAGVSVLSFVFWEKSLLAAMGHMRMSSFGDIFSLFVFLAFAYMLFYLPLRYLYLREERSHRQTWRRLLLIFLLILIRGAFEALRY